MSAPIQYGVFKEEKKNRFLCTVSIDGADTLCYIPSSCHLSNFINLTDRTVLLQQIKNKNARTKYAVYAVKYRNSYILLNLSQANKIIGDNIQRKLFSFLGPRKDVYKERVIDGYKSDLYIGDTDTVVEIKSILSLDSTATFPTVFSERANRQLADIKELLKEKHQVFYIFTSMYSGVKRICINDQQKEYHGLFNECSELGMRTSAVALGMKNGIPFVKAKIDVLV